MAHIATPEFLSRLKRLYPPQSFYVRSPWYAVAAITFTASNCPEEVPRVLEYVLRDLDAIGASHEDQLTAARKIRDAVFKSGNICGFPKVINALILLHKATPVALQDKEILRNPDPTIEELTHAGKTYFDQTYGETAKATQDLLSAIYPDLGTSPTLHSVPHTEIVVRAGFWVTNFAYGYSYAFMGVTSPMETSFAMISALIAIDTPKQIEWHLEGTMSLQVNLSSKEINDAYQNVVAGKGIDWAVFTYDKGTNDLKVQSTGDGYNTPLPKWSTPMSVLLMSSLLSAELRCLFDVRRASYQNLYKSTGVVMVYPKSRRGSSTRTRVPSPSSSVARTSSSTRATESDVTSSLIMQRVEAASGARYSAHNEKARKFEPIAPVGTNYTPIGKPDIAAMRRVPPPP
ncbi:hypothetical protein JVU11DRAFT_6694 [Chiua virens]|nr:hypothetical protein JVU11DRAFT_6694 [Chiua virens]